jgi:fructosamine-3-kinase
MIDDIDTLTALVLPHIETDPASVRLTPITTGKHNRSYWVACDAADFVLRVAPPDDAGFLFYESLMMRQEPGLHALIHAETAIPVAAVIAHDFSRARIDRDYLLMTALPGTSLSDAYALGAAQRRQALRQVGTHLRALHTLTADAHLGRRMYGYLGAHRPMPPQPTWTEAFHVMWNMLLDDVVACGTYTETDAQAFRDLLDAYREVFAREVEPCLLHMDVWEQNILVDAEGNVTGLVDFDRALWGDVEIEFAVLDYCGISEPAFWEGYGLPRDTSPAAQIRRQFYLLYEVQKYMPIRVWRRNNPADALRYKAYSFSLADDLRNALG